MNKNAVYGSIRRVKLNQLENGLSTIELTIAKDFGAGIKIKEEGSLDELQKKYGFDIDYNDNTYDTDCILNTMCELSKEGDKYTFVKLHKNKDEDDETYHINL